MLSPRKFPTKAHETAYRDGARAKNGGLTRTAPYGCESSTAIAFRKSWFDGYDSIERQKEYRVAVAKLLDVMLRCDSDYAASVDMSPTTDEEWDAAIAEARVVLAC